MPLHGSRFLQYNFLDTKPYTVKKHTDVPGAVESHGFTLLRADPLRQLVTDADVQSALSLVDKTVPVFHTIATDQDGNFIDEVDKRTGKATAVLLSDYGTEQRRQVLLTGQPKYKNVLKAFRGKQDL